MKNVPEALKLVNRFVSLDPIHVLKMQSAMQEIIEKSVAVPLISSVMDMCTALKNVS